MTVRYDMFAGRDLVDGLAGFGPEIDDPAMNRLRLQVDSAFRFRISKDFFYDVIADQARDRRFHPVRDYLDALRWDGVPRLDTWLASYAGAADASWRIRRRRRPISCSTRLAAPPRSTPCSRRRRSYASRCRRSPTRPCCPAAPRVDAV